MSHHTTRPQWVARAVTISLWAVGSAYLLKHEMSATPDPVVMASVPIVWAVVLALPVLATYARLDRQWVAMALIWLAAIVGSAYTLNATIGRQASVRDAAVAQSDDVARQRRQIEADRAQAKVELDKATARCGAGKICHPATVELIGLYERQIAAHDAKLASLTFAAPAAGEHRVAALLALATGADPAWVADLVALLAPCLFGLTLELAAFAAAMYGWHPCRQRLPAPASVATLANVADSAGKRAESAGIHPVIEALIRAGRPVNNGELAKLMSVCDGEATKRRREVANLIVARRVGRECMVSLRQH